jgi:hypothetical protein
MAPGEEAGASCGDAGTLSLGAGAKTCEAMGTNPVPGTKRLPCRGRRYTPVVGMGSSSGLTGGVRDAVGLAAVGTTVKVSAVGLGATGTVRVSAGGVTCTAGGFGEETSPAGVRGGPVVGAAGEGFSGVLRFGVGFACRAGGLVSRVSGVLGSVVSFSC